MQSSYERGQGYPRHTQTHTRADVCLCVCAHLLNPLNALPAQLGRHSHLHCTRVFRISVFRHCSPLPPFPFHNMFLYSFWLLFLWFLLLLTSVLCCVAHYILLGISFFHVLPLVTANVCRHRVAAAAAAAVSVPAPEATPVAGVWASKRVLYLSYLLCLLCTLCVWFFFLAVTPVLIAPACACSTWQWI